MKKKMPKFNKIEFADQVAIEQYEDLAEVFVKRIFGMQIGFISDESSLHDFIEFDENPKNRRKQKERKLKKIEAIYGVDVSDIEGLNLVKVLERIRVIKGI